MDRSDVEMKKGLVQGGVPNGDSQCNGLVPQFQQPAADAERPSDSREKWAAAISEILTEVPADSSGRIRGGNLRM